MSPAMKINMVDGEGLSPIVADQTRQVLQAVANITGFQVNLDHESFSGIQTIPFLKDPNGTYPEQLRRKLQDSDLMGFGALGNPSVENSKIREKHGIANGVSPMALGMSLVIRDLRLSGNNHGIRPAVNFEGVPHVLGVGPFNIDVITIQRDSSPKEIIKDGAGGDAVMAVTETYTRSAIRAAITEAKNIANGRPIKFWGKTNVDQVLAPMINQELKLAELDPATVYAHVDSALMGFGSRPYDCVVVTPDCFGTMITKGMEYLKNTNAESRREPLPLGYRIDTHREQFGGFYTFEGLSHGTETILTFGRHRSFEIEAITVSTISKAMKMTQRENPYTTANYQHGNVVLFPTFEASYPNTSKFWEAGVRSAASLMGFSVVSIPVSDFVEMHLRNPKELFELDGVKGKGVTYLSVITENRIGDVISDLMAAGIGGPGFAGSFSSHAPLLGKLPNPIAPPCFETVPGTGIQIDGSFNHEPNSVGQILALAEALHHKGKNSEARLIEIAVAATLKNPTVLFPRENVPGSAKRFTDALVANIETMAISA
ncbi:MAG: isocitrate/isopropylmalate family dehydrogenase [bacterium]|nr:isocitrate/isopropylmalate family dehydrogenase [bacterium]